MYDFKIEKTTAKAIKQNLNGINKISKERVLIELYKILDIKNFCYLNQSIDLKEIFVLIFPEFENLDRLERLTKICDYSQINKTLLLAILLLDEKNSHEYFCHKYNVSNLIKDNLNLLATNFKILTENKSYFNKDLEKNIYLNSKDHLINLNIISFVLNKKSKVKDFSLILKSILRSKIHKLSIDGKYLMDNGVPQGALIGKVLKKVEEEWLKNDFKITKNRVKEIIKQYSI